MTERSANTQLAPYPKELADLVHHLQYKPGWRFTLSEEDRGQGCSGLTLDIVTCTRNSYHPEEGENYRVHHLWPVPPAAFDQQSWRRWLLDQIIKVETHEACEFFQIDGEKPYAPNHGPGRDPYVIFEYASDQARRTSFRGEIKADDE